MSPLFSVIIPTRNRASLFRVALQSVLEQTFGGLEILVIDDGSTEDQRDSYRELLQDLPEFVRVVRLAASERGHGQSYALNAGVSRALGEYLCFLDDDDQWTDPKHLSRIAEVISSDGRRPDVILANQRAFQNGVPLDRSVWIEDLQGRLKRQPSSLGGYQVTPAELLQCRAHCHLNTMTISAALYQTIGGMDEGIRYECDRDFYLRAVDHADLIMFLPNVVSRHNIPDPLAKASMSTAESELSKRLYQLRVFDKAALFSSHAEVRDYAMQQRAYVIRHIAQAAAARRQFDRAAYYARQGLASDPGIGSLGAAILYQARHWLSRSMPRA